MIFLSLININFYLLSLSASVLPQTDNPPLHTKCYGRGFLTPCNEGEGEGGNGSVAFVSFAGVGGG